MLQPVTKPLHGELHLLCDPLDCFVAGYYMALQPGFVSDFASIPRLFWRVCGHPAEGEYQGPSLFHDALYQSERLPRDVADALFRQLLLDNGVGTFRAYTLWCGVRAGGWAAWRGHTDQTIATARRYLEIRHVQP